MHRQSEACLLDQSFIVNDSLSVKARLATEPLACFVLACFVVADRLLRAPQAAIDDAGAKAGVSLKLARFARLRVGDGIEREAKDFAAEVAAAVRG